MTRRMHTRTRSGNCESSAGVSAICFDGNRALRHSLIFPPLVIWDVTRWTHIWRAVLARTAVHGILLPRRQRIPRQQSCARSAALMWRPLTVAPQSVKQPTTSPFSFLNCKSSGQFLFRSKGQFESGQSSLFVVTASGTLKPSTLLVS